MEHRARRRLQDGKRTDGIYILPNVNYRSVLQKDAKEVLPVDRRNMNRHHTNRIYTKHIGKSVAYQPAIHYLCDATIRMSN